MNRIKEVLIEQGRTQKWLANRIHKSPIAVNSYCNNHTQPKLEVMFEIASVLGIRVCDLINENYQFND